MTDNTQREFLTTRDVANMTGYTYEAVRRAMKSGKLAASRKSGDWRTTRANVAEWCGLDDPETRQIVISREDAAA